MNISCNIICNIKTKSRAMNKYDKKLKKVINYNTSMQQTPPAQFLEAHNQSQVWIKAESDVRLVMVSQQK